MNLMDRAERVAWRVLGFWALVMLLLAFARYLGV